MMQAFPKEWKICKITDLISPDKNAIKVGPFGSQIKKDEMWSSGYKVYGQENVILNNFNIGDRFVDAKKFLELRTSQLFSGDVVITMMGTGGQCRVVPDNIAEGIMDSHLMRIQCNNKIENFFLARLLQDFDEVKQQVFRKSQGSIMEGLSAKVIKSLALPVPPKIEQQKISSILTGIDYVIDATEKLINKEKMLKKGLMADLLAHGIDKQGCIRSPQTHTYVDSLLGIIPEGWGIRKLGNCVIGTGEYGLNAPAVDYAYWLPTYLRITDIDDSGHFIQQGKKSVSDNDALNYLLQDGDIVFARTGNTTGKTYLYNSKDGPLVFAGFLIRFRPNPKKLLPYFLKLLTETESYWSWVITNSARTGQPGINASEYANLDLILPSIEEQQKIVTVLSAQDRKIETEETNLAKLQNLKKGLMGDLLSGKVRVKI